ncbi:MAG: hypothetical protein B0D92_05645 [Spirochaeta sp. LUC14_002_19_P3]|nr:MAG: hypothetical protein B0D92_05645 [Spirochaeta sp. LUC14_002_19_P3]
MKPPQSLQHASGAPGNPQSAPWLAGLNPAQAKAVTHGEEPLLILAGAGSGKTRVITSRIAWMVAEKGFDAASILAVTFTNKAAAEMKERVVNLVPTAERVMIRTFHSFGAWLLRRNAAAAGLSSDFTIYDNDDQISLLAQILEGKPRRELRLWASRISRAKDEGLSPNDDLRDFLLDPAFPDIYHAYEQRLRSIGNVDFGDLILLPIKLLQTRTEIRERIRQRFRVILVDEYQDTNIAQYRLLRELSGPHTWLGVVGDDDQSIYRFRGAEVENILEFPNIFPGTKVVKLEQNYRSTATILNIASTVVANNSGRLGKTLWTAGDSGEKALIACLEDQETEAEWCADQIEASGNFAQTAILYRTNAQSRVFETIFRRRNIPCRVIGTVSFYQREEVKDVLAYLAWISNPLDEVAFRRIANKPLRGLGKASQDKIISEALTSSGGNILTVCSQNPLGMKGKAAKALSVLSEIYQCFSGTRIEEFEHLGFLIQELTVHTGLIEHYREIDKIENSRRTENIQELINAAASTPATREGLTEFLELVELDQSILVEENEEGDKVTLITMHNTKGLEFDRVFITGLEDGLFPRNSDDTAELEEERRLFYVAITRARRQVAFTLCRRRLLWGSYRETTPSEFLEEIPPEAVQHIGGDNKKENLANPWHPGVSFYHEDYGVGIVQKRTRKEGSTAIIAVFESGQRAILIPEFSAHKMEILSTKEYARPTKF